MPLFNPKKDDQSPSEKKSTIEGLEDFLYSRRFDQKQPLPEKTRLHSIEREPVLTSWPAEEREPEPKPFSLPSHEVRMALWKKLLIGALIFLALSAGTAFYVFFVGGNVISSNNVDIAVLAPVSVSGGEELNLQITVRNNNNTALQSADLLIEYPEGTRQAGDLSSELKRYREPLGTILPGESVIKKVRAVLFGEEGAKKTLAVSVEYRVSGSNAIFYKEKRYDVNLSSAPVSLIVSGLKEASANQELSFVIDLVSNSSTRIEKPLIKADYPFGFEFLSSDPKASFSNNTWQMGDLPSGGKRKLIIKGKITGQDSEEKTFHFSAGTASVKNSEQIGTTFLTTDHSVAIKKPLVGVDLALDGDTTGDYIAKSGRMVRADITWVNNLGEKIVDAEISARFIGTLFDKSSVNADQGFFRSIDNTIVWNQNRTSELATLDPDERGRVSFSFGLPIFNGAESPKNAELSIEVKVKGRQLGDTQGSEEVISVMTRKLKLETNLALSSRILYFSGPFTNTGPIPPKVEKPTSYTIVWTLTNSSNNLSDVKVTATLPPYVEWLGVRAPETEAISYNPIGGTVTWDAGSVKAGTGFVSDPKEVSFQLSFLPSLSQVNTAPIIVGETVASGDDDFTDSSLRSNVRGALTTDLNTDPLFRAGQGAVVK